MLIDFGSVLDFRMIKFFMISQNLTQRQQMKILPQQIQWLHLCHLTTLELEQHIKTELEDNPLLQENRETEKESESKDGPTDFADWDEYGYDDIPDYKTEYANYFPAENLPERPIVQENNFQQVLKEQIQCQTEDVEKLKLANYLVDSLNDWGFLDIGLDGLAETISFKEKKWYDSEDLEEVLKIIQQLDPPGIGARNIRECLLLQLERLDREDKIITLATKLISECYDALTKKELKKVRSDLKISQELLREVLEFVGSLQLRPIQKSDNAEIIRERIVPDFVVTVDEDELKTSLARQHSQSISINHSWMLDMQKKMNEKDKAGKQYLKNKLQSAEWFLSAIQQRESTMSLIINAIVEWQKEYFLSGDMLKIKPMILKNIAEKVNLDISTVSRITSNKYAATPYGNILLKSLFSEGIKDTEGKIISTKIIQQTLEEAIAQEDKSCPLTDIELVHQLSQKGYKLARRTVAKYREILHIPAAHVRAVWK
ncbi:MAG: RNA polymerase sigma-54 factor [Bacteroidetes bacterium]|nr:MAG: RNA polymerase sigma-54 factor [Bacteroidota bacterium]